MTSDNHHRSSMLKIISKNHRRSLLILHELHVVAWLGTGFAIWLWVFRGVGPPQLWLAGILALLTGLGITVGIHRLVAHRAFETFAPVRFAFAVLGCMAGEAFFHWVAWHRQHHQHADSDDDPHSPRGEGPLMNRLWRGLHAHCGWFFHVKPDFERYIPDLLEDPVYCFVERTRDFWYLLGMAVPTVAAGIAMRSWEGALLGFLWGGPVRILVVYHITFSVNSICHLWGSRPFRTEDSSRNNPVIGVLALGEGWHNNHHAFPGSARQGLFWWQLDLSYLVICFLEKLGLAWNVNRPSGQEIQGKLAHLPAGNAGRHSA